MRIRIKKLPPNLEAGLPEGMVGMEFDLPDRPHQTAGYYLLPCIEILRLVVQRSGGRIPAGLQKETLMIGLQVTARHSDPDGVLIDEIRFPADCVEVIDTISPLH